MKKYYELLEIKEDATPEEIKKAFKKLAIKHHPDKNNGNADSEEMFKKIQEAYSVLSDPQKKINYDTTGNAEQQFNRYSNPYSGFEDIFENMGYNPFDRFKTKSSKKTRGQDIRILLDLNFNDIISGKELDIKVTRREKCHICSGTGGSKNAFCHTCNGNGVIGQGGGFFNIKMECPTCKGSGQISIEKCDHCSGLKHIIKTKKIHIKIKPGISTGDKLALRGQGNQDADIPGDVIIMIKVRDHEFFDRDGNDILLDIPISFTQAVFGDKIEVPSVIGKVKLAIPEGTESGKILKLNNAGINGGNMYIRVNVNIPKNIDSDTKKILDDLEMILPSAKKPIPNNNK